MYLNGSLSVSPSLKVESAPALGAPVSPHHNVRLQDSSNGLKQILQVLPGVCKWQALDNHLYCTSTKNWSACLFKAAGFNLSSSSLEEAKQQCY